jgi:hypothetical protein
MEKKMENQEIKGFHYSIRNLSSFEIIGFTKIVNSGGEMYDEIIQKRKNGKY